MGPLQLKDIFFDQYLYVTVTSVLTTATTTVRSGSLTLQPSRNYTQNKNLLAPKQHQK
jgi:hypothetical protein